MTILHLGHQSSDISGILGLISNAAGGFDPLLDINAIRLIGGRPFTSPFAIGHGAPQGDLWLGPGTCLRIRAAAASSSSTGAWSAISDSGYRKLSPPVLSLVPYEGNGFVNLDSQVTRTTEYVIERRSYPSGFFSVIGTVGAAQTWYESNYRVQLPGSSTGSLPTTRWGIQTRATSYKSTQVVAERSADGLAAQHLYPAAGAKWCIPSDCHL